ncbi:unnamed protein product [Clonostachys rhizophaga]|uniref:DNA mismatch repair protein HSM3 N-terminal domain-containing protein n=1 Tax=Clonostachys rhizophaga TaxID=160324 RepID=A0A9N9VNC7_9HYPO|nr:unnamed protein product [Clonostachys rhizophaga]
MPERIVPQPTMENVRISGLEELQAHLQELVNDSTLPFNEKLFDDVELQLTEDNIPPLLPSFLPPLTTILKSTTQDPTPCLTLTIKLLSPLPLARTLTIADPPSLITALQSPLPGANQLALAILHKGAATPSDAAILSTLPDVIEELVEAWLSTDNVSVAEKAAKVLGDLLEVDCDVVAPPPQPLAQVTDSTTQELVRRRRAPGHARLWDLVFGTRPILSLVPEYCSPSDERTVRQVTLSQGRLLRLLPRLATLNLAPLIARSAPDLFAGESLLYWASLKMIDYDDVLVHLNLVDFFETLVSVMRVAETRSPIVDEELGALIRTAAKDDTVLRDALRGLPDRTIEEEAEPLREYITKLLQG